MEGEQSTAEMEDLKTARHIVAFSHRLISLLLFNTRFSFFLSYITTRTSEGRTRTSSMFDRHGFFLAFLLSLYYFTVQPWAILARCILVLLSLIHTKATATVEQRKPSRRVAREMLAEELERITKRSISIESSLNDQTLARCHSQSQSPLYSRLPKELRDLIFVYACSQSPNEQYPYDANAFFYRPGHTARLKTYTALLQSCRRIWLEANALPLQQAELSFWFQRGPYDRHPDSGWRANIQNERDRYLRLLKSLEALGQRHLSGARHVHLFMQMFQAEQLASAMEDFLPYRFVRQGFMPKRLTITIRSTDWWNWEQGQPLSGKNSWMQKLLDLPILGRLEELAIELEIEERRADQLEAIIQQMKSLEGKPKLVDLNGQDRSKGCKFVFQEPPTTMQWTRSPRINNEDHAIYAGMSTLQLRATILTWRNKPCEPPGLVFHSAFNGLHAAVELNRRNPLATIRTSNSRAMMYRSRAQRELRRHGGWMEGRFPEVADTLWANSTRQAEQWQEVMRERYEQMVGDMAAKKLLAEWEAQGSLLKFTAA